MERDLSDTIITLKKKSIGTSSKNVSSTLIDFLLDRRQLELKELAEAKNLAASQGG